MWRAWGEEKCVEFWWEILKERGRFKDLGVDVRIIL
jgi:hypothetical protein